VLLHDFLDKNEQVLEMWSRARGDNLNRKRAALIFGFFILLTGWLAYRRIKTMRSHRSRPAKLT
jgi:hypothetical protein